MFDYLIWLKETDSTQRRLKEGSFPCGTVFVADWQKEGKGRKGRRWESQEGGLYFSFVICEEDFRNYLQLPLVAGLAISDFLDSIGLRTTIKWPNDVYTKGRKIAGILVEKSKEKIVVGIGLNVNQKEFPEDLKKNAISIFQIKGREENRLDILTGLLDFIESFLEEYRERGFSNLAGRINDKLIFKEEEVIVLSEKPEVGILKGINDKGFLILQTSEGEKEITSGDVSLRLYHG